MGFFWFFYFLWISIWLRRRWDLTHIERILKGILSTFIINDLDLDFRLGWSGCDIGGIRWRRHNRWVEWTIVGLLPFKKFTILEGLQVSENGDFSIFEGELKAFVICGWDNLNGVNPWATKENIVWEINVQDLRWCIHYCRAHLKRWSYGSFENFFCIIIGFDCDLSRCVDQIFKDSQLFNQFVYTKV